MSLSERADSGRQPAAFFLLKHLFPICFAVCLAAAVLPLWVGRYLPCVDWPQHLFLINLMDELKTVTIFARKSKTGFSADCIARRISSSIVSFPFSV